MGGRKGSRKAGNMKDIRDKMDGRVFDSMKMGTYLHSDDCVNEKQHRNQKTDIRQRFERLNEGPEKNSDCVSLSKKFD